MKRPKLVPGWKRILFRSWANWLAIAASLLGCLEFVVPMFQDVIGRGPCAIASLVLALLVPVVRIISQPGLHDDAR